jgi:hypothetical protein
MDSIEKTNRVATDLDERCLVAEVITFQAWFLGLTS